MPEPVEKQICPSCGASFDAHLETCPFCGFVNETADEKKFYNDLDASKKDLREMVDIPEEKATREVRRASRLIAIVLIVLGVLALAIFLLVRAVSPGQYHRDEEADYLWLQENIPALALRYTTVMRYKATAKKLRQIVGLADPVPAAVVLTDDDNSAAPRNTAPDVKIVRARAIWLEVVAGVAANPMALVTRIEALVNPEQTEDANMLAGWREKYENKITVRTKYSWWRRLLVRRTG